MQAYKLYPITKTAVFCLLSCLCLYGCSTTNQAYLDSLKIAINASSDIFPSQTQVDEASADLVYATIGGRRPVTLALAFIEGGDYKWVSSDGVLLSINKSMLIRTSGFERDLLYTELPPFSLEDVLLTEETKRWGRSVDFTGLYNLSLLSEFFSRDTKLLDLWGYQFSLTCVEEKVMLQNPMLVDNTSQREWTNNYCFETKSKQLLTSDHYISPFSERLSLTYLSRAARLITEEKR